MKAPPLDDPRMQRLAQRLAIPERAPDDHFVGRIDYALRARALAQGAARQRREQLLLELGGGAALLFAAHQIAAVGEHAALLLTPAAAGLGGFSIAAVAAALMLSLLAPAGRQTRA
jgi:hypothetical protein